MKKNIIKYLLIVLGILAAIIIYLSLIGIETDKFNGKIKDKISQNISTFINAINKARPSGVKGVYIKKVTLSSSMGPGVKIDYEKI